MPWTKRLLSLWLAATKHRARVLSARLVNAIYRLIKACQIQAENNNAVSQVVDFVVASIHEYCQCANLPAASILFTPNAVFVNRPAHVPVRATGPPRCRAVPVRKPAARTDR